MRLTTYAWVNILSSKQGITAIAGIRHILRDHSACGLRHWEEALLLPLPQPILIMIPDTDVTQHSIMWTSVSNKETTNNISNNENVMIFFGMNIPSKIFFKVLTNIIPSMIGRFRALSCSVQNFKTIRQWEMWYGQTNFCEAKFPTNLNFTSKTD